MIDGQVVDAICRRQGQTVTSLAARLDVSRSAVQKWKAGRAFPGRMTVLHLARALDVDPLVLFGVPVPFTIEFETERAEYRMGYIAALGGRELPMTMDPLRPWVQGWKAGAAAVAFGYRE